jgi:hypothetical protein
MLAKRFPYLLVVLATLGLTSSAWATDHEFDLVVERVSAALHKRPQYRRLLGATALVVRGADPTPAAGLHLAMFDTRHEATGDERQRVADALSQTLLPPWQLVVHKTARHGDQETWVYARQDGTRIKMLVSALENGQATLVTVRVKPDAVVSGLDHEQVTTIWSNQSDVKCLWSGVGDGSGFGPGIAFQTADGPVNLLQLHGSGQVTYRHYLDTTLGARLDPTGHDMRIFSLDLTGRYRVRPEEDFFGIGPTSPAERTMYDLQERGLRLTLGAQAEKWLKFGIGEDYSGNRVFGGRAEGYANAQQTFASALVPGLARGANLFSSFTFAELDKRDYPDNAHKGAFLRLSAADYDGTGHSNWGFWNYTADARAYVPLTRYNDVLAWRGLGMWNAAKGGAEIPFFMLARLGDSSTLRGYRPYRFYGRNALTSSLEYRHFFDCDWGVFGFTDVGQVFDLPAQLTRRNMRLTWGGGLLFGSGRRHIENKLFFGKTDEGHRWFLTWGPTF